MYKNILHIVYIDKNGLKYIKTLNKKTRKFRYIKISLKGGTKEEEVFFEQLDKLDGCMLEKIYLFYVNSLIPNNFINIIEIKKNINILLDYYKNPKTKTDKITINHGFIELELIKDKNLSIRAFNIENELNIWEIYYDDKKISDYRIKLYYNSQKTEIELKHFRFWFFDVNNSKIVYCSQKNQFYFAYYNERREIKIHEFEVLITKIYDIYKDKKPKDIENLLISLEVLSILLKNEILHKIINKVKNLILKKLGIYSKIYGISLNN